MPCFREQSARAAELSAWLLLCTQVKILCPILGSVVSDSDLSVTGDQKDHGSLQVCHFLYSCTCLCTWHAFD